MKNERIGLFGGTFNPIHLGHLRAAEIVQEKFLLDEMLFTGWVARMTWASRRKMGLTLWFQPLSSCSRPEVGYPRKGKINPDE